jgi:hypothetical protein
MLAGLMIRKKPVVRRGHPSRDELWTRYRQAVVHPYVSGLATAGLGGMQDDGVALEGLRRAVTALEEIDTVAALQQAR